MLIYIIMFEKLEIRRLESFIKQLHTWDIYMYSKYGIKWS